MTRVRRKHGQEGFILVVVLGAVLVLSTLLFGFARTTRTSLGKADGFYRTEQAWNGAWGGLQMALAVVRDVNALWADPQSARLLTAESTFSVEGVQCSVVITEENGLLNVNRLKGTDGQPDRQRIDQFLRLIDVLNRERKDLPPIGYGIVPAIMDWVDADNEPTHLAFVQRDNTGAENDYYQARTPPYPCRNGPIDALDELLWIKGMTREDFGRLRPFLTCRGDGKIDINAAPRPILQSLCEEIDAALAEMIVRQRTLRPLRTVAELRGIPGMTDNAYRNLQNLTVVGPQECFYRVRAQGSVEDYKSTIEALLQRNAEAGTVDILQYREF